jgi:hypothetical protein
VQIYSGTIRRRFGWWGPYVQRGPTNALRQGRAVSSQFSRRGTTAIVLGGSDRVFRVSLPAGLRELHRTALRLADLGENQFPAFMIPAPDASSASSAPYDFDRFKRTELLAVASVTRHTGWYARGTFSEYETEFYFMKRRLRLLRFLQQLRTFIFETANQIIARAGAEIGFQARIVPGGLPSLVDIEEAESMLDRGELSVNSLFDRFSLY